MFKSSGRAGMSKKISLKRLKKQRNRRQNLQGPTVWNPLEEEMLGLLGVLEARLRDCCIYSCCFEIAVPVDRSHSIYKESKVSLFINPTCPEPEGMLVWKSLNSRSWLQNCWRIFWRSARNLTTLILTWICSIHLSYSMRAMNWGSCAVFSWNKWSELFGTCNANAR